MKFVIVLACLLAFAYADEVLKSVNEVNPDGFVYAVDLSDGTSINQSGKLKDPHTISVQGSYEYVSKEGKVIKVSYTADEEGYKPVVQQV